MRSELYGVCPDEIEDNDIFVAEVKPDKNDSGLRIVTLVKWTPPEED
jgi:hypothetical protein